MIEETFFDYLQECFDNDLPISFITIINTIKSLGYNTKLGATDRDMNNAKTNRKMEHIVCLMILKNEKVNWNLWLGFIDHDNVIVCQLYSLYVNRRNINMRGRPLITHYDFIERKITDKEKEQFKL